ncbi:MAG: hypothetical protein U9Q66_03695 [Patescibacteria group bacterium]|nr:hypothetical protein [Patescibacteria group bacterium]
MIKRITYIIDKYDFDIQYHQDDFIFSDLDSDSFISSVVLRKTVKTDFDRLLLTINDDKLKELSAFINKLDN